MELKRIKTTDVYPSEGNPREDMGDLDALATSFELNPVHPGEPLNPPLVVQDGGVYRIVDGERRWRAMQMAGTTEFDAVVCEDWEDADAALAMLATDDKKPLDEMERSRGVQRALLLGVEPQRVEKAARRKGLRQVKRATERLGVEAESMSLDHLIAVAELADAHPELSDCVANANEDTWERVYREAKSQVANERAANALRKTAKELGCELQPEDERPDDMCYAMTCRTPDDLTIAYDEYGNEALYMFRDAGHYVSPCVVVNIAVSDEDADPEREAAKERRDAMAIHIDDMLYRASVYLISKVMGRDPMGTSKSMTNAVERWLGNANDFWSQRSKTSSWLDQVEWEGSRYDGHPDGLVGAAILREWMINAEPGFIVIGMACGVDEMTAHGRECIYELLNCLEDAITDGWQASASDIELIAKLRAVSEGEEEE